MCSFRISNLRSYCRRDIVLELEALGFEIEASHHEVADGHHEIDWKYGDAVSACNNIQTFKLIVKTVAGRHHLLATFMPKPLFGINGSGMHFNMSLFTESGNSFHEESTRSGISKTAKHFIAGLIQYAPAFTAVCNPTATYKRLVPGYEAPVYGAWSEKNRSPLIRIPVARGNSTRVELRSAQLFIRVPLHVIFKASFSISSYSFRALKALFLTFNRSSSVNIAVGFDLPRLSIRPSGPCLLFMFTHT